MLKDNSELLKALLEYANAVYKKYGADAALPLLNKLHEQLAYEIYSTHEGDN